MLPKPGASSRGGRPLALTLSGTCYEIAYEKHPGWPCNAVYSLSETGKPDTLLQQLEVAAELPQLLPALRAQGTLTAVAAWEGRQRAVFRNPTTSHQSVGIGLRRGRAGLGQAQVVAQGVSPAVQVLLAYVTLKLRY